MQYNFMEAVRGCELKTPFVNCFHCQKVAEQPRLCPRCAKGFCNSCLFVSVTSLRQECPSCGARVREEEFLQPEAVVVLAGTIAERVRREGRRGEEREQCAQHQLPLAYFCVECNHPLCADCALLTSTHTGHRFVSYRDIYQRIKKRVFDEFPRFDRKIKSLQQRKSMLYSKTESLYDQYRRYKKVFQEAYISYTQRVENACKNQQQMINARYDSSHHRLAELEHLRDNIYEEMEKKTQLTLIKQSNALVESINALTSQEPPLINHPFNQEHSELEDLIPQYTTWKYRLEGFSTKSGIVYSEGKLINGVEWRLKVYPKGNGLARQKYLSVFVEMSKALGTQNKYEYRIELLNPMDSLLTVKREYCSTFQIGQCWGYNQFQPLQQLYVKQFIDDDSLLFQIGIRNRNFRSLVYDQVLYIQLLKAQITEREKMEEESKIKKIKSLRERERPLVEKRAIVRRDQKSPEKNEREKQERQKQYEKQKEYEREEVPFEQSHAYGLIQQYLRKQQLKKQ